MTELTDLLRGKGLEKDTDFATPEYRKACMVVANAVEEYLIEHPAVISFEIRDALAEVCGKDRYSNRTLSKIDYNPHLKKIPHVRLMVIANELASEEVSFKGCGNGMYNRLVYFRDEEAMRAHIKTKIKENPHIHQFYK